jgi:hypothetical protein
MASGRGELRYHVIDLVALQSHMLQRDEVFCLPATASEQPCIAH